MPATVRRRAAYVGEFGTRRAAGGRTSDMSDAESDAQERRVDRRAAALLPEEDAVGSGAPKQQAEVILEDSDVRSEDRDAAPGTFVEHRTSDEATPPTN